MAQVEVERDGHVMIVTMNRPKRKNAMTLTMFALHRRRVAGAERRTTTSAAPSSPAPRATSRRAWTCARWRATCRSRRRHRRAGARMKEDPGFIYRGLLKTYRPTKPVIAAVEGVAIAGGTEILQGTDIRVAGESARFGVSEARWSLYPMGGSAVRLRRQIPYTVAADILLTGKHILAPEAQGDRPDRLTSCPTARRSTRRARSASTIAANGPLAVEAILKTLHDTQHMSEEEAFAYERAHGLRSWRRPTRRKARRRSPRSARRTSSGSRPMSLDAAHARCWWARASRTSTSTIPTAAVEAVELMAHRVRARRAPPSLLAAAQTILVPRGTWRYRDPGRILADAVRRRRAQSVIAELGVLQQTPCTRACRAIASGDARRRHRRGRRGEVPRPPRRTSPERARRRPCRTRCRSRRELVPADEIIPADRASPPGSRSAPLMYSVIETALRTARGETVAERTRGDAAELWAAFSDIAAANPDAWRRDAGRARVPRAPVGEEPDVAAPYTRWHCSQWNVDQAVGVRAVLGRSRRSLWRAAATAGVPARRRRVERDGAAVATRRAAPLARRPHRRRTAGRDVRHRRRREPTSSTSTAASRRGAGPGRGAGLSGSRRPAAHRRRAA